MPRKMHRMSAPPKEPLGDHDGIEREPPNWRFLIVSASAIVLIFFLLLPWLFMRFTR